MSKIYNLGIIGGGVSGAVMALQAAKYGIESIIFEEHESVVNGPPFCHLHAGGNLYPDITDEECRILMEQSIDMAKLFPQSIDERPTFISIPKSEKDYETYDIETRLKMLVKHYKKLIKDDPSNKILGEPEDYYKIYNKKELSLLKDLPTVKFPKTTDEWMSNTLQLVDIDRLKLPVFIVQEFGWNLFRLAAQAQLALIKTKKCDLKLNTSVTDIKDIRDENVDHNWEIQTKDASFKVKYLVNSCGFKTGIIDESLHLSTKRLIEFKAAYVSKWEPIGGLIPELIFHGKRGTSHGMAQLTPYCEDYYQIHGMTKDITLFKDGLVKSKKDEVQPRFNKDIRQKLNVAWEKEEINTRTENGIEFISKFLPSFETAVVGGPPMFGAQQIPGDNPDLRVGEVSFPEKSYARSEIVKASSALTVANQIIAQIQKEKIISSVEVMVDPNFTLLDIPKSEIDELASELTIQRGYPEAMSRLLISKD
ncbi:NAD(P)-binding protein [Halpernia frigidisoli]|uniref:FAD dependent oxidoreductase n=1 Tax=Halpernia frigidisoli TaxID=1125876 RepID=A0A1I3DM16_9FLAO|nr:FAD-dependent oxidoreductase [Halpernia frigidisoli]SFH87578.1 FAD dependent oxidoreductase [Halpernia frigidisoli]